MKIILGDNQFFGVNHFDLTKGILTKNQFEDISKIEEFINNACELGMDGFMINSNALGYKLISEKTFTKKKEIHYSIPYPHKYANMINENGMLSLGIHVLKNTSILSNSISASKFFLSKNLKHIISPILDIEIPNNLRKGSYVYLQNIITDLILGIGREDLLLTFIEDVLKKGYKPGIITLNPVKLNSFLKKNTKKSYFKDLIVCFNINKSGFNVFPNKHSVEKFIKEEKNYKLMGMSILSSGGANIQESLSYIKDLNLDYIVFGTSKLSNIETNLNLLN